MRYTALDDLAMRILIAIIALIPVAVPAYIYLSMP